MSVKCGNKKVHGDHNTYHVSVADVKACFAGRIMDSTSQPIDFAAREAAEYAAAAPVTEVRELTDNERRTLDRMRQDLAKDDPSQLARSARYREIWTGEAVTTPTEQAAKVEKWDEEAASVPMTPEQRREHACRNGMTLKQYDFLVRLIKERQTTLTVDDLDGISRYVASTKITDLLDPSTPRRPKRYEEDSSGQFIPAPPTALATEDGIYRNPETGEIFKLQFNRAQGDGRHLYAKQLVLNVDMETSFTNIPLSGERAAGRVVDLEWRYVGSIAKAGVKAAWRVTKDEAAAFGKLYGVCVRCHRDLTAEESIDRAMGPICAGKMGW